MRNARIARCVGAGMRSFPPYKEELRGSVALAAAACGDAVQERVEAGLRLLGERLVGGGVDGGGGGQAVEFEEALADEFVVGALLEGAAVGSGGACIVPEGEEALALLDGRGGAEGEGLGARGSGFGAVELHGLKGLAQESELVGEGRVLGELALEGFKEGDGFGELSAAHGTFGARLHVGPGFRGHWGREVSVREARGARG